MSLPRISKSPDIRWSKATLPQRFEGIEANVSIFAQIPLTELVLDILTQFTHKCSNTTLQEYLEKCDFAFVTSEMDLSLEEAHGYGESG